MPDYPFGLRPKSIAVILDNTFRLYRRNFKAIALFSLLIGGLGQLLVQFITALLMDGTSVADVQSMVLSSSNMLEDFFSSGDVAMSYQNIWDMMGTSMGSILLSLAITIFVSSLITGGVVSIAAGYYHGETDSPVGWLRRIGRMYGRVALTGFAQLLFIGMTSFVAAIAAVLVLVLLVLAFANAPVVLSVLGIALIVVVLALSFWPELIFPVAIIENKFGFMGFSRTLALYFKNFWRVAGLLVLVWLITLMINLPLSLLYMIWPMLEVSGLAGSVVVYWAGTILSVVVSALTAPLMPIAMTLGYLDIRVRREGYDIALRQRDQASRSSEIPDPWDRGRP